jgi:Cellulase (glycosyl hydrolase family 5)
LRARSGVVAAGLCTALALALAPAAHARSNPSEADFFGLNVEQLFYSKFEPSYQWPTYISRFANDGVHTARVPAYWDRIEPYAPGGGGHTYYWDQLDEIARQLGQFNVRMIIVISHSPQWASSGPTDGSYASYPPYDSNDFAVFARAVASRYGPGGNFWRAHPELPERPPVNYEIWNEENHEYYWRPAPDPGGYVRLYNAARAGIQYADPNAHVIVGGVVWNDDAQFIRGLYGAGGSGWSPDGIALHPYASTVIGTVINMRRVYQTLKSMGQRPPLYLSELGWVAAEPGQPGATDTTQGPMADSTRAGVLSLLADISMRADCNFKSFVVYDVVEPGINLYQSNANPNLTGQAFASATTRYGGYDDNSLNVCDGATPTPVPDQLTLELDPRPQGNGCYKPFVTYRSYPIEFARIFWAAENGGAGVALTEGHGLSSFCVNDADVGKPLRMFAEVSWESVPSLARSDDFLCNSSCTPIVRSGPVTPVPALVRPSLVHPAQSLLPGRIGISIRPKPLRVGKRTRVVFTVKRKIGKRRIPVVGALIHIRQGGRTVLVLTNKRGRAAWYLKYAKPGRYKVTATNVNTHRAVNYVRVVRGKSVLARQGKTRGAPKKQQPAAARAPRL